MREILRKLMDYQGHDEYSLAKASGVSQPTINRFFNHVNDTFSSRTVEKLAKALNVKESQLRGDLPIPYLDNNQVNQKPSIYKTEKTPRNHIKLVKTGKSEAPEKISAPPTLIEPLSPIDRMSLVFKITARLEHLPDENLLHVDKYTRRHEKK